MKRQSVWHTQLLPLLLTAVIFLALSVVVFTVVQILNHAVAGANIAMTWHINDVLFGLVIYLKTSVDFAIFMGNLIKNNPGYRSRIAVEVSTALANAFGTILILVFWTVFKQIEWLLALMVLVSSLALLRLAEDGLEHADYSAISLPGFSHFMKAVDFVLNQVNRAISPFLSKIIPKTSLSEIPRLKFWALFGFAFTVPFILGLDNFAGYVPLFSVVKVFGFAIGIFLGHMILNILLYLSPRRTIKVVANPVISLIGSLVFVGLAIYGLVEAGKILIHIF